MPASLPLADRPVTRRLLAAALAAGTVAVFSPVSAHAGLIPPASPWPAPVAGATNPLIGTRFVLNGGYATANASLRVWLPVGGKQRTKITRTIGERTVLRGQLHNRDTRRAIRGATVTVAAESVYGGGWVALGNLRTDRDGLFRVTLPPGGSARAAILYWPTVNASAPVYSRRLLVRASGRVNLARPYSGKHRSFRFDGRVSGAPIPPSGLLVALQVRNRHGNWVTARLDRTNSAGRYRVRYRFTSGRLTVRVRVPAQTGWPLFGGESQPRHIRVP